MYKGPHARTVESLSARSQKRQHYEDIQHRQRQNTASRQEQRDSDSRQSHEEGCRLHAGALGIFPIVCRRSRPPAESTDEWRGRGVRRALRWGMTHVADQGFRCTNLRKFYVPFGQTLWKPTKDVIALRLSEWPTFKEAIDKLHRDNSTVANFSPCFVNQDHATPELIANTPECSPHRSTSA